MQYQKIIGITGYMYSGKSIVAKKLQKDFSAVVSPFAAPLKEMLLALGVSREELYGMHKERPSKLLCGKTPRWAMKTLGTEWARELIGEDVWVNAWEKKLHGREGFVVSDDTRFPNEVKRIRDLGGLVIRVKRPVIEAQMAQAMDEHGSERMIGELPYDRLLVNDGTIESFRDKVQELVEDVMWANVGDDRAAK